MQTHKDADQDGAAIRASEASLKALQEKAAAMTEEKSNVIAAGHPGETATDAAVGRFIVRQLPDDPLALRISIGEAREFSSSWAYVSFRGDPADILELLERAIAALRVSGFNVRKSSQVE